MKRISKAKKYLVFVRKDLLEYFGLEKSQNILPVENRFNEEVTSSFYGKVAFKGKVEISDNPSEYLLKCSYNKKEDALFAINEIIFRTSKLLANDISFHISANNIAKVVKNEDLNEKSRKNREKILKGDN